MSPPSLVAFTFVATRVSFESDVKQRQCVKVINSAFSLRVTIGLHTSQALRPNASRTNTFPCGRRWLVIFFRSSRSTAILDGDIWALAWVSIDQVHAWPRHHGMERLMPISWHSFLRPLDRAKRPRKVDLENRFKNDVGMARMRRLLLS